MSRSDNITSIHKALLNRNLKKCNPQLGLIVHFLTSLGELAEVINLNNGWVSCKIYQYALAILII